MNMKKFIRNAVLVLAGSSLLQAGSCIQSWKVALGPLVSGDKGFLGIELETNSGVDFTVPIFGLGDNFDLQTN